MKHLLLMLAIFGFTTTVCNQQQKTTPTVATNSNPFNLDFEGGKKADNRLFPDKLRGLPQTIIAAHYPNPVSATYEDSMYVWKHNITITTNEDVQIIEYGSFVYTDSGWYLRVSLTPKDFETSFNCKNAFLKKGVVYTDNNDWRRGPQLIAGDAMWYFIGKNSKGALVKGIAPIETEATLVTKPAITTIAKISKATINWTGYGEVGGYSLTGTLPLKGSTIEVDSNKITFANIIFNMKGIAHENEQLVSHLKGEDFFDVNKFATAQFVTEKIIYKNENTLELTGKLTIKGIVKTISFTCQQQKIKDGLKINGTIKVDRTIFGIKYNSSSFFGNLGDQAIKNEFDVAVELMVSIS
ncbi:YceI family protein [Ferruginibacter yonginensis]|uniref:YceI family protein n=1 Tax=Ferruginibacter yonginensis TaxID=1310416 RepID=A0ABV8QRQ1_9BACT